MVEQYPHWQYVRHSEPATRNPENGDFIPGSTRWTFHARCREETNGKGEEIHTADQRTYRFTALVQLPKGTPRIVEGTTVLVADRQLSTDDLEIIWIALHDTDGAALTDGQRRQLMVYTHGSEPSPQFMRDIVRITGDCAKFDKGQLHCRLWL